MIPDEDMADNTPVRTSPYCGRTSVNTVHTPDIPPTGGTCAPAPVLISPAIVQQMRRRREQLAALRERFGGLADG